MLSCDVFPYHMSSFHTQKWRSFTINQCDEQSKYNICHKIINFAAFEFKKRIHANLNLKSRNLFFWYFHWQFYIFLTNFFHALKGNQIVPIYTDDVRKILFCKRPFSLASVSSRSENKKTRHLLSKEVLPKQNNPGFKIFYHICIKALRLVEIKIFKRYTIIQTRRWICGTSFSFPNWITTVKGV